MAAKLIISANLPNYFMKDIFYYFAAFLILCIVVV